MPSIDIKAVVIAFATEFAADFIIGSLLLVYFAGNQLGPDMTHEQILKVSEMVYETTAFIPWAMVFGTATMIGGAYFAARIAKRIPYYHGLAMGVLAIVYSLVAWPDETHWFNYLGILISIPASLLGAHLAKKHIPAEA
jgi:hypothetical protein